MNLHFRKIKSDDLDMLLEWRNDDNVQEYLPSVKNIEDQYTWWIKSENDFTKKYRIVRVDDKDYGVFSLVNIDYSNKRLEIGGYIPRVNQGRMILGKKLAVSSIECIKHYAFEFMNFNKIIATVPKFNLRALHLDLSCGFEIEGVLKEWFYHHGVYHDDYILSFLKKDWNKDKFDLQYTFDE